MAGYSAKIPYEGDEKYIFISYSHKNKAEAESFIGRLQHDGYRVWYDEGIHPGSEWDEFIATHVENCALFFALMSAEYMQSDNCKDELNFARDLNKKRVLIFLEEVEMPAGMRLRLGRLQNIHKKQYTDEDKFYQKVYLTEGIEECHFDRGAPEGNAAENENLPMSEPELMDSIKDRSSIYQERLINSFTDSATIDGITISLEIWHQVFQGAIIESRKGYIFTGEWFSKELSEEIHQSVWKGIRQALKHGPIAGGAISYLKIHVCSIECSLGKKYNLEQFENAGKLACRKIFEDHQSDLRLYEPMAAIRLRWNSYEKPQQKELQRIGNIIDSDWYGAVITVPYLKVKTAEKELELINYSVEDIKVKDFKAVDITNAKEIHEDYLAKMLSLSNLHSRMINLRNEIAVLKSSIDNYKILELQIKSFDSTVEGKELSQMKNELFQKQKELSDLQQDADSIIKAIYKD